MTTTHPKLNSPEAARLKELATYVRSRREALSPENVGLSTVGRRRVKGLRREEVAELAGISTDWYTWIEQGRDVNLSASTLENLSSALQLDAREKLHLFKLAKHASFEVAEELDQELQKLIQQLLDGIADAPAYVLDSMWNIRGWNSAASELFGDFGRFPLNKRNMVRLVFTEPSHQKLFADWQVVAQCTIAHFRADSIDCTDSKDWQTLISDMLSASSEFARLWSLHSVSWSNTWKKTLIHPNLGSTEYHGLDLELTRPAKMRMVTYLRHNLDTNREQGNG